MLAALFLSSFASITLLYGASRRQTGVRRGSGGVNASMQQPIRPPEQGAGHSNEALMLAYQAGDATAFDRLVQRWEQPLLRFLDRILHDRALAEDALMETFFKLHRTAPQWEPRAQLKTWIYRLATQEAINILRARRIEMNASPIDEEPTLEGAFSGPLADPASTVELRLLAQQEMKILHRTLETVPPIQRTVFELYYSEEQDTDDIASILEIPVGSVHAYLCMVRQKFRIALEKQHRV